MQPHLGDATHATRDMIRLLKLAVATVLSGWATYKKRGPPWRRPIGHSQTGPHHSLPLSRQRTSDNFNPSARRYTALYLAESTLVAEMVP
jgi:hypothetical protein